MPITDPKQIRLTRQDDLEAIIGHPPGWTLKWGMTVVFCCIALLLGISWFVSYPDIVQAPAMLTTENPPIRLVAGASAKITALLTDNEKVVEKGELLAILENPANTDDVLQLESLLKELSENDPATYLSVQLPEKLQLGTLQSDYADFSRNFEELKYFLNQNIHYRKIRNLKKQIAEIKKLDRSLRKQIAIFEKELVLSQRNVWRDSTLYHQQSLSQLEYENTKAEHLNKQRQLEKLRSGSANNRLEIRQLEAEILDLRQRKSDDENEHFVTISSDIQRLMGAIEKWKQTWLLIAPIAGQVALTNAWSEQQFVEAGKEVLTIIPRESAGKVFARAQLKGNSSGKVDTGMVVHIRLSAYPYQEYGVLNGYIARIADVPTKLGYEIEVELPHGMVTSYNKEVEFRQEMEGTARIITEERSLLMRILEKIRAAFED